MVAVVGGQKPLFFLPEDVVLEVGAEEFHQLVHPVRAVEHRVEIRLHPHHIHHIFGVDQQPAQLLVGELRGEDLIGPLEPLPVLRGVVGVDRAPELCKVLLDVQDDRLGVEAVLARVGNLRGVVKVAEMDAHGQLERFGDDPVVADLLGADDLGEHDLLELPVEGVLTAERGQQVGEEAVHLDDDRRTALVPVVVAKPEVCALRHHGGGGKLPVAFAEFLQVFLFVHGVLLYRPQSAAVIFPSEKTSSMARMFSGGTSPGTEWVGAAM